MLDKNKLAILNADNLAQIAIVDARGRPSVSSVWYSYSEDLIWIATTSATEKGRSLDPGSAVALAIVDREDNYKQLLIKGVVDAVIDDSDMVICDRLSMKYIGKPFPHRHTPLRIGVAIRMARCRYHSVRF